MDGFKMVTGTKVLLVLTLLGAFAVGVAAVAIGLSGGKDYTFAYALLGAHVGLASLSVTHSAVAVTGWKAAKK